MESDFDYLDNPGVPDPNAKLGSLNGAVFVDLVEELKKQDAWRVLAASLPVVNGKLIERNPRPAEAILTELNKKNLNIGDLCTLLTRCNLLNAAALLSEPRSLVIEVQPGINDAEQYVPYGGELRLEIVAIGVPPPEFLWHHENEELLNQRSSVLIITDFGPQHTGEYKCLVSQNYPDGPSQFSTPVNVLMLPEPPVIQKQPEPVSVRIGEEVIISCSAVSYPLPTYEWMRDNTVLVGQNDSVLKIPCASLSDCGMYKCSVSNGYNVKVTKAVKLSVYESPLGLSIDRPGLPIVTEKVALLIANAEYTNLCNLLTPYNDVKTLSNILKGLGFKVISLCDLTLLEMINAVKVFCDLVPEGAYAVFYFAGHGFELHDKYMLPVESPSPDMYRRSDSLCERHVIREILAKKPNLLLLMLDMCLKMPKREENPGMYDEQVAPIAYESQRNLLQAYATTSNLEAYERTTEENGIYMKHLMKHLANDMPIVYILQKVIQCVSEESPDAVDLQMPSLATNIVSDKHYLSVPARDNQETKDLFDKLTLIEDAPSLYFPRVKQRAHLKFQFYQNCFINVLEVHFYNLQNWTLKCGAPSRDLCFGMQKINGVKVLTIHRLQKMKTNSLSMTVQLWDESTVKSVLVDFVLFEIKNISIASASLWFRAPLLDEQNEESYVEPPCDSSESYASM